jgi:hypothetical protein
MLTCSFIFPFIYFSVSEHLKIGHHRLTTIQNKSRQKCAFFFLFAYFFAQLKSVNVSRGSLDQMKEGGVNGIHRSVWLRLFNSQSLVEWV